MHLHSYVWCDFILFGLIDRRAGGFENKVMKALIFN